MTAVAVLEPRGFGAFRAAMRSRKDGLSAAGRVPNLWNICGGIVLRRRR
jgi:hypothetical protein